MNRPSDRLATPADVAESVLPAEYSRLLGYPAGRRLDGALLALAETSRAWYREHGRAWVYARQVEIVGLVGREVELAGGQLLESRVLVRRLRRSEAPALMVVAVSAGPEVDARTAKLWRTDRPDEAFFLDRFAAAVAEHLAMWCGETLRTPADGDDFAALPGYSPGYDGWDLDQQVGLYDVLTADPALPLPGPLQVLPSGMLTPKNSLLAVFGQTSHHGQAAEAWATSRCAWCSLKDCDYRRPPQRGALPISPPAKPHSS